MTNNQKCIWSGVGIVAVAAIGSVFTYFGQGWYAGLIKPSQWPPSFLFPIVWSIIYILAFLMFCFLLKGEGKEKLQEVFIVGAVNGVLNILWCLVFFTLRQPFLGLVVLIVNLGAGIYFVLEILKKSRLWFYIMLIYPVWLGIATALNLAVWILN